MLKGINFHLLFQLFSFNVIHVSWLNTRMLSWRNNVSLNHFIHLILMLLYGFLDKNHKEDELWTTETFKYIYLLVTRHFFHKTTTTTTTKQKKFGVTFHSLKSDRYLSLCLDLVSFTDLHNFHYIKLLQQTERGDILLFR